MPLILSWLGRRELVSSAPRAVCRDLVVDGEERPPAAGAPFRLDAALDAAQAADAEAVDRLAKPLNGAPQPGNGVHTGRSMSDAGGEGLTFTEGTGRRKATPLREGVGRVLVLLVPDVTNDEAVRILRELIEILEKDPLVY